ncbi:FAD-dependent oxidoreductase [Xanthobacter sp. DSM 24535]|uniref:FAD-dependent oxidoreductase n=1 Tax=Roseixanthobacter psychrophilus TaxID=3119917 RepID=UPI00372A9079
MKLTDISAPDYFHKVVDCQWACPAHTPVPEYIRLIAQGRYTDAYMINWKSNVFPGILGRTCDRPCEPACRRGRVEQAPVAICRLKRVAADFKDDIRDRLPRPTAHTNGKRVALVGAGPASLTVARDLAPLGYDCTVFDGNPKAGGMIRSQIPKFRLPDSVIDEECGYILDLGVTFHSGKRIDSLKALLSEGYDAVFIGSGAPRGRELDILGRKEAATAIHVGLDWLASVSFGHVTRTERRVVVIGGGNTAMDCGRSARRLGGEDITVVVREGFDEMPAASWEKEALLNEGITISAGLAPKAFVNEGGRLTGLLVEPVTTVTENGRSTIVPTGEPPRQIDCDEVVIAIGQQNAFPWIERDIGIDFDKWDMPVVAETTFASTHPKVFFGGDAARGPKNIISAVAHGHDAALSIHRLLSGEDIGERLLPHVQIESEKLGIHEWAYDSEVTLDRRFPVPSRDNKTALKDIRTEVELGYDPALALAEADRCLNCDVETVFSGPSCIECDSCVDICPMDCITFTENGEEEELRLRLRVPALNPLQDLYVADGLKTGRVMVKDEDLCLHCGLCAERCPTGAWSMQKYFIDMTHAGDTCPTRSR